MTLFENTVIKSLRVRIDEPGLPEAIYHRTKWFRERGGPCGVEQRIGVCRESGRMSGWVGMAVGGACRWEEWVK